MSVEKHGKRYSKSEREEILEYLEKNTYKTTCEKYEVSEATLSRWRKRIKSESKKNTSKIIISLPTFWLDYLNEQIESDYWENYSDAILSTIRYHFKSQKSIRNANTDAKYLENIKDVVPAFLKLNPDINSVIIANSTDIIYKTEQWESVEGVINLIKTWKKKANDNKRRWETWAQGKIDIKEVWKEQQYDHNELEFQDNTYFIRDISVKHLLCGSVKGYSFGHLLGLKRKLSKEDIYIIAKTKEAELNNSIEGINNVLKKIAMGLPPTIEDVSRYKSLKEPQKIQLKDGKRIYEAMVERTAKEREKIFQIKTNPTLMRLAEQVNIPLKLEDKEVLNALERQIGKKIERITADPEQETSKQELMGGNIIGGPTQIPWMNLDMDFPSNQFPCHYMALNGKITHIILLNLELTELPSEILKLKNIKYLCLNSNKIADLPESFTKLEYLEYLSVDNNQFTMVPDTVFELSKLRNLSMQYNKISQIPELLINVPGRWAPENRKFWIKGTYADYYYQFNFSGNQIKHNSLSKKQQALELQGILFI